MRGMRNFAVVDKATNGGLLFHLFHCRDERLICVYCVSRAITLLFIMALRHMMQTWMSPKLSPMFSLAMCLDCLFTLGLSGALGLPLRLVTPVNDSLLDDVSSWSPLCSLLK